MGRDAERMLAIEMPLIIPRGEKTGFLEGASVSRGIDLNGLFGNV